MNSKVTAVNVITGFLGAGKTSTILGLLSQKPKHETWAVIVNEFGEIGIDGSLLRAQTKNDDVVVLEVTGGVYVLLCGVFNGFGPESNSAPSRPRTIIDRAYGTGPSY
jgi:hypothetical protein